MKERISIILKHFGLTSSKLAEILGVQRSGISHILSGRNNPSYDFIVKLMAEFPEINANWLLQGDGNMLERGNSKTVDSVVKEQTELFDQGNSNLASETISDNVPFNSVQSEDSADYRSKQSRSAEKYIEKVVVLYNDGTFLEYRQKK